MIFKHLSEIVPSTIKYQ